MIIVLDLSGVVFTQGMKISSRAIGERYGLDPMFVEEILNGPFAADYRKGLQEPEEFWKSAAEKLGIPDIPTLKRLFFDAYEPQPGAFDAIRELRKRHRVGFLSNSPSDRVAYLDKKYAFKSVFDFGLCSYEAHAMKPDEAIYKELLRRNGLVAAEVLYCDDKRKNLDPAARIGMRTRLIESVGELADL